MSPAVAVVLAAAALAMFLLVWMAAGRLRNSSDPARSEPGAPAPLMAPAIRESPRAGPTADADDPIVAESKQFIDRESRHAGLPEPPAASDGRVHLRNGGSITTDEYRDAQRRVNESPVMHTPIPPPPMP